MFCFFFLSLPHGWLGLPHVRYTRLDAGPELQVPSCRSRAAGPELQAIALFMGLSFTLSGGYLGDVLPMTHGRSASKWIEVCNRRNWHSVPPAHIHWEKPVPWLSCHQWSREVHPTVVGGTATSEIEKSIPLWWVGLQRQKASLLIDKEQKSGTMQGAYYVYSRTSF